MDEVRRCSEKTFIGQHYWVLRDICPWRWGWASWEVGAGPVRRLSGGKVASIVMVSLLVIQVWT